MNRIVSFHPTQTTSNRSAHYLPDPLPAPPRYTPPLATNDDKWEDRVIEVMSSVTLSVDAATVWTRLSDFSAIVEWHPNVSSVSTSSFGIRLRRILSLQDGSRIVEDQITDNHDFLSYTADLIESPLPVAQFMSRFSVSPIGMGSTVSWSASFEADRTCGVLAEQAVKELLMPDLSALGRLFEDKA